MAHQRLDGFQVISVIQKGGGKGVPNHVGVNSFLDQGLFRHRFDEAIDSLRSKGFPFVKRIKGLLLLSA